MITHDTDHETDRARPADDAPAGVARGRLAFGYLGELRADLDGRRLDLGPRLQRHLLAVLLIESGRVVPVDRLVDLLWGETPPAAALASLQAYVSQLRRILEPGRPPRTPARVIVTQDPGYVLRVEPDQVDGLKFARLATRGRELLDAGQPGAAAECLDEALSLWRGSALVEFEDEPWAVATAARLNEARDAAQEDRIDAWLALGRHGRAASELEELVQERPLRERRWAQLILANYRSGRQADALRAYQRCRSVLAEQLGIEPGPELRRLETAVLAQDPSLDPGPVTAGGPAPPPPTTSTPRAEHGQDAKTSFGVHQVQMDRIGARLAEAAQGRGGIVVLVGEPGVGKTTLAEHAADMARRAGLKTFWSRCLDASAAPAYWPWVQMLRQMPNTAAVDEARRRLEGEAEMPQAGNVARFLAYEAVIEALRDTASDSGVVALIDDLHAADEPSLELLALVAGDLARLPVLLVATLRDTEPSLALDRTLGELLLRRGAERLAVTPLDPREVTALAEQALGSKADAAVCQALFERTGGNVFYLLELMRLLTSEHRDRALIATDVTRLDVPSGVRDVIVRRAARLPDNTRAVVTLAAVAGQDADLSLLESAARLDSEQLMLALEPAVAAGLLSADDTRWSYRFRHPLIRESLYANVGRVERCRLHARLATSLEDLPPLPDSVGAGRLAQLAHHYLAAGPLGHPGKAIDYGRQAARAAMQVGAWGEAIRLFKEALAVMAGDGADAVGTRCDVLVELARAYRASGRIPESHRTLEESIELADEIGDEDRVLAAAVAFGAVSLWGSRAWGQRDPRLVAILQRQLARLEGAKDERVVLLLSTLAGELYFDEDAGMGLAYAERAVDMARSLGDPAVLGVALSGYLLSTLANDTLHIRKAVIEEFLSKPELGLGPDIEAVLRFNLLTERLRYGELARFDAELGRCRELATDILHSPELEAQLLMAEACRAGITGDVAAARQGGERGLAIMLESSSTWSEPSQFVLDSNLLLVSHVLADHAEEFEHRADHPDHPSIPHLAAPAAALAYVQRGDLDKARELTRKWFAPPPKSWSSIQALSYWAQVAAAIGEPDPSWLYEQLLPHSGELALVGIGIDIGGAVDSLLAGLLLQLGRPGEALERARAGLALERRAGSREWLARTSQLIDAAQA